MTSKNETAKVRGEKFNAAGREVWQVEAGRARYQIPDEYVATVDRAGVLIHLVWPSAKPVRSLATGTKVEPADLVSIFIAPAPGAKGRDSSEAHRDALGRYESRPSARYPGLVEYFSVSKKTGEPVVHYYASEASHKLRTPSGNSYVCTVLDPGEAETVRCDSLIALPDGNSMRVRFARKHLAEWARIYSETVGLVQSFRKG